MCTTVRVTEHCVATAEFICPGRPRTSTFERKAAPISTGLPERALHGGTGERYVGAADERDDKSGATSFYVMRLPLSQRYRPRRRMAFGSETGGG